MTARIVLAALLAILRPTTRRPVLWLWGIALVATGLVLRRAIGAVTVTVPADRSIL